MARTRTTKAVAQRIDLNYFNRPTPFKRAKLLLAVLVPAIALVWIGWHVFGHDNRVYSSGRLSKAHAVLEQQCAACHVHQASGFAAVAADSACLACHDGPAHHPSNLNTKIACAECHLEHRGRVSLVATKKQSCAQCHGNLSIANRDSSYAKHIQSFEDGHPEFAALRSTAAIPTRDPGAIKLNHALHVKAIRRGPNGPNVQLDCADCHRAAASADTHWEYGDKNYAASTVSYTAGQEFEPGGSQGLPTKRPWSDRQLMAPVKFANACAGCHLLTFDKRFDEGVPHDNPEVIHSFLTKRFADYIAAHPTELREVQEPPEEPIRASGGHCAHRIGVAVGCRTHSGFRRVAVAQNMCAMPRDLRNAAARREDRTVGCGERATSHRFNIACRCYEGGSEVAGDRGSARKAAMAAACAI